jgi:hypothetical protein
MNRKNTKRLPGPFFLTLVSDSIQRTVFYITAKHPSGGPPELRFGPKGLDVIAQILIQLGATDDDLSNIKEQVKNDSTAIRVRSTDCSYVELVDLGFKLQ